MSPHYRDSIPCPIYHNARKYPQSLAYIQESTQLTYEQAHNRIAYIQKKCESFGINAATNVAILASNSLEYILLIFALNRINAVVIPLNMRWSPFEWKNALQQARSTVLFSDHSVMTDIDMPDIMYFSMNEFKDLNHVHIEQTAHTPSIDFHNVSSILFTSGSAGEPKGVVLTNGNHYYNAMASNSNLPLNPQNCWLLSLPLYHVGGMAILYRAALAGAAVAVLSSFDAENQIDAVLQHGCTHISCVPVMLHRFIQMNNRQLFPKSLQHILLGGGPVSPHLIEEIQSLNLPVCTTYGMTETASQISCLKPGSYARLHTAGEPLEFSEVMILDKQGEPVPVNMEGEIAVRGPIVSPGYVSQNPEEAAPPHTWFRSGDTGFLDADGYLTVLGRMDDMFISGGENIYPAEIEQTALRFQDVMDCRILVVENAEWGKRPVLFVETQQGPEFNTEKLHTFLGQTLPKLKMPDLIFSLQSIPRTSTGKIDRNALYNIYSQLAITGR